MQREQQSSALRRATNAVLELGYRLRDHVDHAREWHQASLRICKLLTALAADLEHLAAWWEAEAADMHEDDVRAAVLLQCARHVRALGATNDLESDQGD